MEQQGRGQLCVVDVGAQASRVPPTTHHLVKVTLAYISESFLQISRNHLLLL